MESRKFGRKFRLLVQENTTTEEKDMVFMEITDPFTVQFSINRDVMSSLNKITVPGLNIVEELLSTPRNLLVMINRSKK